MKFSTPFFVLARTLMRVPAGCDTHPGVPAAQVQTLVRHLEALAWPVEERLPAVAKKVRDAALALGGKHRLTGLSRAETWEMIFWLCQTGGFVAAVIDPLEGE